MQIFVAIFNMKLHLDKVSCAVPSYCPHSICIPADIAINGDRTTLIVTYYFSQNVLRTRGWSVHHKG